ncbi:MAG TPA: zinc ABC transporter substrate-binding protein [Rhodopila sp.]
MRRRSYLAALGLTALGTARVALSPAVARAASRLPVVASFSILADMTRQVGGDAVSVEEFVGPDGDAHVYEPRPKDLRTLMASSLLVRNGLGLEGWMERLTGAVGFKGKVVVAAEKVKPRTMREDGGVIATDPHAWQDPANAVLYVQAIADGLVAADPGNAARYRASAARYVDQITQTGTWIESKLADIPADQRRIITTHDAFGYYGVRYRIEFLSAEGISTDSEPSAKAIAALIAQIKRENVRAVFIENMTSPRMAQMLARETGATLGGTVYSDALSPSGGPAATYLDMLHYNTGLFAKAMRR